MSEIDVVLINIMGREFKIKCPKDKIDELQKAADYLDSKMQEVRRGDKSIAIDRVAITAALNIAHDLILAKQNPHSKSNDDNVPSESLDNLKQKINRALAS